MREQLVKYVQLLFAGTKDANDMQQEILQNTLDRYDDLIAQGKSPEAAYRLAITGIGDLGELLGSHDQAGELASEPAQPIPVDPATIEKKKRMRALAIALYICCVIPVILLGNVGDGILGVCLMFILIAVATALIILSSNGSEEEKKEIRAADEPKTELGKAIKSASGILTLCVYLGVSFYTGAWHITWVIFLISAAIEGLVKAIIDLKEAKQHET